jgi:hypothetical protein
MLIAKGTQRRKKKHVNVQAVSEDKKLMSAIKKFGILFLFIQNRSTTIARH